MNNLTYSSAPNHTDRYVPVTDEKYVKQQILRMNRMYMNNTFEVIDYDMNLNYNNWEKSLDNKMPMSCTVCSDGISKILTPDNVLYNGCLCNVIKDKNVYKQKFIDKCAECEYYKYCQGDCKRFGYYCAFPKKSFDRFLKIYNKRKKVINNG